MLIKLILLAKKRKKYKCRVNFLPKIKISNLSLPVIYSLKSELRKVNLNSPFNNHFAVQGMYLFKLNYINRELSHLICSS